LTDEKTKDRELRALLDARKELEAEQLTVITEDEEGNITLDGVSIEIVPAWKWLMVDKRISVECNTRLINLVTEANYEH